MFDINELQSATDKQLADYYAMILTAIEIAEPEELKEDNLGEQLNQVVQEMSRRYFLSRVLAGQRA